MSRSGLGSPEGGAFSPFRPPPAPLHHPSPAYPPNHGLSREDLKPRISHHLLTAVEMEHDQQQRAFQPPGMHLDAESAAATLSSLRLPDATTAAALGRDWGVKTEVAGSGFSDSGLSGLVDPLSEPLFSQPGTGSSPFPGLLDASLVGAETTVGVAFDHPSASGSSLASSLDSAFAAASPGVSGDPNARPFPCDECGKRFQNNSALVKHKLIHSEDRRFACELCGKAFKRQDHLSGHLNVHKSVKPFQCIKEGCDKSYCDGRSLRRHLEHGHNIKNPSVQSQKGTMYVRYDGKEHRVKMRTNTPIPGHNGPGIRTRHPSGDTISSMGSEDVSPGGGPQSLDSLSSTCSDKGGTGVPVECTHCNRTFKNMPALNGHMRLHSSIHKLGPPAPFGSGLPPASATAQTPPALLSASHAAHHSALYAPTSGLSAASLMYGRDVTGDLHLPLQSVPASYDPQLAQAMGMPLQAAFGQSLYSAAQTMPLRLSSQESVSRPLRIETYAEEPSSGHPSSIHGQPPEQHHSAPAHGILDVVGTTALSISSTGRPMPSLSNAVPDDLRDVSDVLNSYQSDFARQTDDPSIQEELDRALGADFGPDVFGEPGSGDTFFDTNPLLDPPLRKRHPTAPSALGLDGSSDHMLSEHVPTGPLISDTFANSSSFQMPDSMNEPEPLERKPPTLTWKDQVPDAMSKPPARLERRRVSRGKPENLCQILKKEQASSSTGVKRRSEQPLLSLARSLSTAEPSAAPSKKPRPSLPSILPYHRNRQKWRSGNGGSTRRPQSLLTGRGRAKPAPLVLPGPGVTIWGRSFHSQLRSPRCWDPPSSSGSSDKSKSKSPPPYTPPPILSPFRQASGLFWCVHRPPPSLAGGLSLSSGPGDLRGLAASYACPKSAPIANSKQFWSRHHRQPSIMEPPRRQTVPDTASIGPSYPIVPVKEEARPESAPEEKPEDGVLDVEVPEPDAAEKPPETDTTPHINVGPSFQAELDEACKSIEKTSLTSLHHPADLLFSPDTLAAIPDAQVEALLKFASSAAVPGAGRNTELALHILHQLKGDVQETMLTLMDPVRVSRVIGEDTGYRYCDTDAWTPKEVAAFQDALIRIDGKDFHLAAKEVGTKTTGQCVSFYYTWKKACPDEYRRLHTLMQKKKDATRQRDLVTDYNLRSSTRSGPAEPNNNDETLDEDKETGGEDEDEDDGRLDSATPFSEEEDVFPVKPGRKPVRKPTAGGIPDANGLFPCSKCSKTFTKVKSRNAHMKSHAMAARAASATPTPEPPL